MKQQKNRWLIAVVIVIVLAFLSFLVAGIFSLFVSSDQVEHGNVALIAIKGTIIGDRAEGFFSEQISSQDIVDLIKIANKNPEIKAILLEINSPGGTAVASEEISNALKKTDKPCFAWIREIGTSGAYWAASSCDVIIASPISITGSIGVIGSYLGFAGLLERYNITYERFVSGKYKDLGTPLKEITVEERAVLQRMIDKIQEYFLDEVVANRDLTPGQIKEISTGRFYLGLEAKELGLVDYLGGKDEAVKIIEEQLNITAKIAKYKKKKTFLDLLSSVMSGQSFYLGQGIGTALVKRSGIDIRT